MKLQLTAAFIRVSVETFSEIGTNGKCVTEELVVYLQPWVFSDIHAFIGLSCSSEEVAQVYLRH